MDAVGALVNSLRSDIGDLAACGPASAYLLNTGLHLLEPLNKPGEARVCFQALLDLSYERILAYPYRDVPDCWRRLYTDTTLLQVLALLLHSESEPLHSITIQEDQWKAAVQRLDKALVVAGAPGACRQQYTHTLIRLIQQRHLPHNSRDDGTLAVSSTPNSAFQIRHSIRRVTFEEAPTIEEFLGSAHASPFIISQGVRHWPACANWMSISYFRAAAGRGRTVPIEIGGTYTQENWSQEMMDFDVFLDALSTPTSAALEPDQTTNVLYLAQHDLLRQLPQLEDDFWPLDYVYMSPPAPSDVPSYVPPETDRGYLVNLWMGPSNTHSPAHTDPYYNCYGQVAGRKLLWVAPPRASAHMYPFGAEVENEEPQEDEKRSGLQEQYMGNTTQVDVLATCEQNQDQLADQRHRFPRFFAHALPLSQQAILEPGDMLFLPPGWWHALKSLDSAVSVSLWF